MTYKAHPLADIFPIMEGQELKEFIANIKNNGLQDPIILCDGKILDGRNRYHACIVAGVEPRFENYNGNDPVDFVVIKNLQRRHLTPIQKAELANTIANIRNGENRYTISRSAPAPTLKISQKKAAKMVGASDRTMRLVKSIKERDPELHAMVVAGKIPAKKAAEIIQSRAMKRVLDAQAKQVAQEKAEQKAAKVEAKATADNERKVNKKAEPAQEGDMNMTIEIAERYIAQIALGQPAPPSGRFIRNDIDTYKDILIKYGKTIDEDTELGFSTTDSVVNYIRGFLSAKKYTVEDLRSLMTKEIYDNFRRENNAKIRFAEEYHPTWGLPKIPLRQAEYNKLLHCLHPDRVARINDPELSQMFRDGLDIVRKLKLTISKPEDMRSLPKVDKIPDTFAEYVRKESEKRSERAKKAAETRKQRKEAPAASPSL
jgi:ParB-like chromosome segregation protein Spo0J